jgi:hypothetical protein
MYADKYKFEIISERKTEKVAGSATHVALRDLYTRDDQLWCCGEAGTSCVV